MVGGFFLDCGDRGGGFDESLPAGACPSLYKLSYPHLQTKYRLAGHRLIQILGVIAVCCWMKRPDLDVCMLTIPAVVNTKHFLKLCTVGPEHQIQLVSWYFEPSQPQRITSGLKQTSIHLLFTLHTSHQTTNRPKTTKSALTQI